METYVDEYSDWIRGTIAKTDNTTHSVEIMLDQEQDIQNIGRVHIKGKEEQKKIRADPNPIKNVQTKSPKQSILRNSPQKSSQIPDEDEVKSPYRSRKSPVVYSGPAIPVTDLPINERLARGARMFSNLLLLVSFCQYIS